MLGYNNNTRLAVIFHDNSGKPVPECLHSGFYWNKDDGSGADNWSYKTCKAPVKSSPPTPNFFIGRMPFLLTNQQCLRTEGRKNHIPHNCSPHAHLRSSNLVLTTKGLCLL